MAEGVCVHCKGAKVIYQDDLHCTPCVCMQNELFRTHLGPEISQAIANAVSPLFAPGGGDLPPKIDRTKDNLFLQGWWPDLCGHIKTALYYKGLGYRFRVVTDKKILDVCLGKEDYRSRSRRDRDDMETNNTLEDIVGSQFDLVILRLGMLGWKNQAAHGYIKEALMLREVAVKPTWLIEVPSTPFGPGNFSYSEDLAEYIERRFKTVNLVVDRQREVASKNGPDAEEDPMLDDVSGPEVTQAMQPTPQPRFKAEPVMADMDLGALGGGVESKYKKKSSWKKKSSGGGPL